jgi:S1-C subfamily serine protease
MKEKTNKGRQAKLPEIKIVSPVPLATSPKDYLNVSDEFKRAMRVRLVGTNKMAANAVYIAPNTILTNKHVCQIQFDQAIELIDYEGNAYPNKSFTYEYIDPNSGQDICVITTEKLDMKLPPIKVKTKDVRAGSQLLMLGYTYAFRITSERWFKYAESIGKLVANVNYVAQGNNGPQEGGTPEATLDEAFSHYYRVDLPVVPGNSGSAVYNDQGELLGLVYALDLQTQEGLVVKSRFISNMLENLGIEIEKIE